MASSSAEVARTLVSGRLPGLVRVAGWPQPMPVQHATDCAGRPMLLARAGSDLAQAVSRGECSPPPKPGSGCAPARRTAGGRTAVLLAVDDRPPVDGAPGLGRVRVGGWVHRLDADEAAQARLEFAEWNPVDDLLDVGDGVTIFAIEVDRVQVQRGGTAAEVELEAFIAADPDPLHEVEQDLLDDLAGHHAVEVEQYFRRALDEAGVPCRTAPRAVRLDRYGFTVETDGETAGRWYRLEFARPVRDRHDLARVLHPVLFPHCHGRCRSQ
jgi:hypothetical protein